MAKQTTGARTIQRAWLIDAIAEIAAMVRSALALAIEARKPQLRMVVHADYGPHYTSWAFSNHIRSRWPSSVPRNRWRCLRDNVMVESLWGRMQTELKQQGMPGTSFAFRLLSGAPTTSIASRSGAIHADLSSSPKQA